VRLSVPRPEIRAPKLCQFWGASPPKIFGATVTHIFCPFGRPRGLLHVCQISAAAWPPFRRYGRRCATSPFKKAVFCTFAKATISSVSGTLIYTLGAAIPLPEDTAAAVGQFLPYKIWIDRTPWEILPPKLWNFNAEVRIRRHLVTASTTISWFLFEIMVENLRDNRSVKYEHPGLITVSTAGTQTWRHAISLLTQSFRYAYVFLEVASERKFTAIWAILATFVVRHILNTISEFQHP